MLPILYSLPSFSSATQWMVSLPVLRTYFQRGTSTFLPLSTFTSEPEPRALLSLCPINMAARDGTQTCRRLLKILRSRVMAEHPVVCDSIDLKVVSAFQDNRVKSSSLWGKIFSTCQHFHDYGTTCFLKSFVFSQEDSITSQVVNKLEQEHLEGFLGGQYINSMWPFPCPGQGDGHKSCGWSISLAHDTPEI